MNRLQKKCVIVSIGFHLFLVPVVMFGPGFLTSNPKTQDVPIIHFVALKTVDALVSGGGNPNGRLPTPPPPVDPTPPPSHAETAPVHNDPPPIKDPVVKDPVVKDPPVVKAVQPTPATPTKRQINVPTKLVARNEADSRKAAAEAKARQDAEAKRRLAMISQAVSGIKEDLSSSTAIELKGPGGGGVPYANFLQAVNSKYAGAWKVPDGVTDDSATATTSITIARSGKVISAKITQGSGNPEVDRSVQETLDRVRSVVPLPENASEDERTVTLRFNVKAKLLG